VRCAAITFDLWATLLDTTAFYREIAARLAPRTGLEEAAVLRLLEKAYLEVKKARAAGRISGEHPVEDSVRLAEELTGKLIEKDALLQAAAEAAYTVEAEKLLLPGAVDALRAARKIAGRVAIVSNVVFWHGQVSRIAAWRAGVADLVDFQVYADEVGCLKPDRCIFASALKMAKAAPGCAVHVGDNFREDLLGALMAGMKGVLVDPRGPSVVDPLHGFAVVEKIGEAPGAAGKLVSACG